MPLGEFIGEVVLRALLELVFYTLLYYTGAVVLWVLTLGRLRLAPLSSMESTNLGRTRWTDWSPWLRRPLQPAALKAEWVCLVGLLVWAGAGVAIYLAW